MTTESWLAGAVGLLGTSLAAVALFRQRSDRSRLDGLDETVRGTQVGLNHLDRLFINLRDSVEIDRSILIVEQVVDEARAIYRNGDFEAADSPEGRVEANRLTEAHLLLRKLQAKHFFVVDNILSPDPLQNDLERLLETLELVRSRYRSIGYGTTREHVELVQALANARMLLLFRVRELGIEKQSVNDWTHRGPV